NSTTSCRPAAATSIRATATAATTSGRTCPSRRRRPCSSISRRCNRLSGRSSSASRAKRLPGTPALATIVARVHPLRGRRVGAARATHRSTGEVISELKPRIVLSRLEGTAWTRKGLRPFLEYRDLGLAEATEGRVGGTIGRAIKKFEPGGGAKRHFHNT